MKEDFRLIKFMRISRNLPTGELVVLVVILVALITACSSSQGKETLSSDK